MAYGSFEEGGITVSSSEHSDDQLAANLTPVVDDTTVAEDEPSEPAAPVVAVADEKRPTNAEARKDPQAKIRQQTFDQREAERRADAAEKKAAALEAQLAAAQTPKPAPRVETAPKADVEPTVDQFDTYEKYVDARARWAARQEWDSRERVRDQQQAEHRFAQSVEQVDNKFFEKYAAAIQEDPDFAGRIKPSLLTTMRLGAIPLKVRTAPDFAPTLGNIVMEEVFQADHPKPMLLHLSDPAVAQRLATLPPDQVRRELVRFDKSQGAASPTGPAPKVQAISQAKPPIRPVGTSPLVTDANEITDDLSVDEHIRRMNAKDRAARRAS